MARRAAAVVGIAAVGLAASAFWRRRQRQEDHVDLYFEDGSMLSFAEDSEEAAKLLPLARDVLWTARGV